MHLFLRENGWCSGAHSTGFLGAGQGDPDASASRGRYMGPANYRNVIGLEGKGGRPYRFPQQYCTMGRGESSKGGWTILRRSLEAA